MTSDTGPNGSGTSPQRRRVALVTGCVLIAITALTTALRIACHAGDPLKARDGIEPGGQHGEAVS